MRCSLFRYRILQSRSGLFFCALIIGKPAQRQFPGSVAGTEPSVRHFGQSGGIRLDMMFIDEGFGSLDEESRKKAIEVLRELSVGNRLIGIISHVTELKEQLDYKLCVTRNEKGSSVCWEIS